MPPRFDRAGLPRLLSPLPGNLTGLGVLRFAQEIP